MYSQEAAERALTFIRHLRHTKGQWAGQPFRLLPWQEDFVRRLFGTLRPDGTRQYRRCLLAVAKKNGKSELAAAIALYLLFADREPAAEVVSAAGDKEQASIVFQTAVQMVQRNPTLARRCRILDSTKRIVVPATYSVYRVVSAESYTKHGPSLSGVIFDELHVQGTRDLWDSLTEGSGAARRQPLVLALTTAGTDRQSICYEVWDYARKVRDGVIDDPSFLPVLYEPDPQDDWEDESTWAKANPSLGAIVRLEELREAYRRAKETPASQNSFRRLRLNQWVAQESRWLDLGDWQACAGEVDPESLRGRPCFGGLDLSSTTDLSAFVLVFPLEDGRVAVLPYFWAPRETALRAEKRDRVPYTTWERMGAITLTEGDAVDYARIEADIQALAAQFPIVDVAFDRWNAGYLVQRLQEDGANMVPFGQGYASMSAPMRHLQALVLGRKLLHPGHPVLDWCCDNLAVEQDAAGNLKPSKAKSRHRIDGMVALVMALGRMLAHLGERPIYEERGVLLV